MLCYQDRPDDNNPRVSNYRHNLELVTWRVLGSSLNKCSRSNVKDLVLEE